jgi:hypothetical protein
VSKHTTCSDVDEDGVKRLVEILGCRCHHRDVDVGAVLLARTRQAKTEIRTHSSIPQKFGAKRTHECCQNLCQDNARFYVKGSNECQKGYYGVKMWCQNELGGCRPALAGLDRLLPVSVEASHCDRSKLAWRLSGERVRRLAGERGMGPGGVG